METNELVARTFPQEITHLISQKKSRGGEAVILVTFPEISLRIATTTLASAYACSVSQQEAEEGDKQRQKEKSE